ncbi:DoxX-like family protein [Pseudomonas sp. ANT_H12B]|uniref:DoxX-like family protein n=1 Tax=Pseudomonas sp. ANT_H12B TaxID=2597348 RepID=UPI0011ECDE06|nr:DoxX-like family protein [Pseudomonas sp. ANT_H12B]KAA0968771.1 DoxX family protein [Pseudomonas sp. ANT_H12B]
MSVLKRVHWIARGGLVFMFAYHGLVPKLLWLSQGERTMIQAHGIQQVELFAYAAGVAEIGLALWLLLARRTAWPLIVASSALTGLLLDVAIFNPAMLREAFNPVTLNVAGLALCAVVWNTRLEQK